MAFKIMNKRWFEVIKESKGKGRVEKSQKENKVSVSDRGLSIGRRLKKAYENFPEWYVWPEFVRRGYYLDVAYECIDCGVQCVWTAAQQKEWYEKEGANLRAKAVRCGKCHRERKFQRALSQMQWKNRVENRLKKKPW